MTIEDILVFINKNKLPLYLSKYGEIKSVFPDKGKLYFGHDGSSNRDILVVVSELMGISYPQYKYPTPDEEANFLPYEEILKFRRACYSLAFYNRKPLSSEESNLRDKLLDIVYKGHSYDN